MRPRGATVGGFSALLHQTVRSSEGKDASTGPLAGTERALSCLSNGRAQQEGSIMRKSEIDHMLEVAVAKALGVKLPHLRTGVRPARKSAHAHRAIKHAA